MPDPRPRRHLLTSPGAGDGARRPNNERDGSYPPAAGEGLPPGGQLYRPRAGARSPSCRGDDASRSGPPFMIDRNGQAASRRSYSVSSVAQSTVRSYMQIRASGGRGGGRESMRFSCDLGQMVARMDLVRRPHWRRGAPLRAADRRARPGRRCIWSKPWTARQRCRRTTRRPGRPDAEPVASEASWFYR
jgi:hypothetical protein